MSGLIGYRVQPGLTSMCLLFSAVHSLYLGLVQACFWTKASNGATVLPPATAPFEILLLPITADITVWGLLELLYILALIASVLLGRWWIIQRFDQLAERMPTGSSEANRAATEDKAGPFQVLTHGA